MKKLSTLSVMILIGTTTLTGCGSSATTASNSSLNFPTAGLNAGTSDSPLTEGSVTFGAVVGATIIAHETKSTGDYDDYGNTSKECGTATTDSNGLFALNLDGTNCHTGSNAQAGRPEILTFTMTGGSYVEESTGATVQVTQTFHSVMVIADPVNAPTTLTVAIGPVTEIAWRAFIYTMTPGVLSGTDGHFDTGATSYTACDSDSYSGIAVCANSANQQIETALGVTDIVGVLPQQDSNYNQVILNISNAAKALSTDSVAVTNAYTTLWGDNGNLNSVSQVSVLNGAGATVSITPPAFSSLQ
ncbi:MAG: hypothetical protein P4M08_01375 [Oligoflexia bacterium]|nr:hypothetical protein [Oligoflexia bacterium]